MEKDINSKYWGYMQQNEAVKDTIQPDIGVGKEIIAFDEGERILILPWAQAGCQIDLRDFRPGDRLAASTSCATVSDMVTKLCKCITSRLFRCRGHLLHRIQFLSARRRQPNQSTDRDSTITKYNCLCKPVRLWRIVADVFKSEHRVFCKNC